MGTKLKSRHPVLSATALAFAVACTLARASAAPPSTVIGAPVLLVHAAPAASSADAEQRLRTELRVVMAELIESGAFGTTSPHEISFDMDTPAQRVSDLGVIVDNTHGSAGGLAVLAVTPGSAAERTGLRAGDRLVSLNGSALGGGSDAAAQLRRQIDALPDGGSFDIGIRRDGQERQLRGTLASVYVPAMHLSIGDGRAVASTDGSTDDRAASAASAGSGCGRISDFDVAPRQQQLHGARIIMIDGVTPGPSGAKSFRVAAGSHVVKVSEHIESRYLSFNDRQRNAGTSEDHYKTITVDVAPNTTVLVAARLNEDKRDDPANGAYWDPVAWKTTPESCR